MPRATSWVRATSSAVANTGFDAHERDPLGSMRVSTEAFGAMTADLCRVADQQCDGRLVADGETTQVMFDYAAGRSVEIPVWLRDALAAI